MFIPLQIRRLPLGACVLSACLLAGCEKAEVDVSLHGVNYGGDAFSYYVTDPTKPKTSGAGGELIEPFAAGGTTCCFTLPKKWRPGIKVEVRTTHWLPQKPDGSLPEVKQIHLVDVPVYANDSPGELWVLRAADGTLAVISSDLQPDHPNWPGKLKGWPIPSLEYRRERWALIRNHQETFVTAYMKLLDELEENPLDRGRKAWESALTYDRAEIKGYSGPADPRYIAFLKESYTRGLNESQTELQRVMGQKP